ncbi:MAG TPA: TylF/MycF/NovP-related O-methyltransferase [Verrucomicrobiae bacterium]|nr:TylF/MycF/NovP-related O-methyltransferase [Verrucomicrobiae bacterium]
MRKAFFPFSLSSTLIVCKLMDRDQSFFSKAMGYAWRRFAPFEASLPESSAEELRIISEVKPFTMTSPERIYGLINAVRYLIGNKIGGDFVECGVWKGGSMMAVAKTLLSLNSSDRELHLFDTYAGMTAPTAKDGTRFARETPDQMFVQSKNRDGSSQWCYSSLEETRRNMLSVRYPEEKIHFIKGPVEETIPQHAPTKIALLRLDTDFYESSKHEMIHLFPRLVSGGVLLLDDYGHWEGQRAAVDEYLTEHKISLLLNRLDYTGRVGIKL